MTVRSSSRCFAQSVASRSNRAALASGISGFAHACPLILLAAAPRDLVRRESELQPSHEFTAFAEVGASSTFHKGVSRSEDARRDAAREVVNPSSVRVSGGRAHASKARVRANSSRATAYTGSRVINPTFIYEYALCLSDSSAASCQRFRSWPRWEPRSFGGHCRLGLPLTIQQRSTSRSQPKLRRPELLGPSRKGWIW
jgi:hypothetical protein